MADLWNRAGPLYFSPVVSSFFFFLSLLPSIVMGSHYILQLWLHSSFFLLMAALRSRCGHYILPCGFFYLLLLSFPRCQTISVIRRLVKTLLGDY